MLLVLHTVEVQLEQQGRGREQRQGEKGEGVGRSVEQPGMIVPAATRRRGMHYWIVGGAKIARLAPAQRPLSARSAPAQRQLTCPTSR